MQTEMVKKETCGKHAYINRPAGAANNNAVWSFEGAALQGLQLSSFFYVALCDGARTEPLAEVVCPKIEPTKLSSRHTTWYRFYTHFVSYNS